MSKPKKKTKKNTYSAKCFKSIRVIVENTEVQHHGQRPGPKQNGAFVLRANYCNPKHVLMLTAVSLQIK